MLVTLSISVREAWLLFALFWAQFIIGGLAPESIAGLERIVVGGVYMVLGLVIFTRQRGLIRPLIRDGFKTSTEISAARSSGNDWGPDGRGYHRRVDPHAFLASLNAEDELVHVRDLPARANEPGPFPKTSPS